MEYGHNIGNQYKHLDHILELTELVDRGRGVQAYKLNCTVHGRCCDVPNGLSMECLEDDLKLLECVKEVNPWYHPQAPPETDWQNGDVAEVKEGWDKMGSRFIVLGPAIFLGQWWVPVSVPDEEDPDLHKESSLKKLKLPEIK